MSRDTSKARGGFADWLGRHDLVVLLAVLFVVAGVWAFVEIADEVREGLTLGTLLAQLTDSSRLKAYFLSVALVVTFLVGLSRVYLGVHYPTDVLAGWSAGLAWALVCWLAARWLSGRGAIEVDGRTG